MRDHAELSWILLAATLVLAAAPGLARNDLAIVGGTIIDVSDLGRGTTDHTGQTVLIEDGFITAVGPSAEVEIPAGMRVIKAAGRYLTPGLVDGFAVLNNQAYAQAYLSLGITTIVGVGGGRRGPLYLDADPGPAIYRLEDVGFEDRPLADLLARVDSLADAGVRVALLMYGLPAAKLRLVNHHAHQRGLATIGELATARYTDAMNCGVDAFVHTTRYSLGLADDEMIAGVAREPFSDELDSPKWRYYRWLSGLGGTSPGVAGYAARLAASGTFLLPTASLLYLHQPGAVNPWSWPAAALLDPADINRPADKVTGRQDWTAAQHEAYGKLAAATERIEIINRAAGCHYLAGSGTDVWGTMPGISLHTELAALVRWGLSPREALAAATGNYALAYGWSELGGVTPGCRADILVLTDDPRLDITNLQTIEAMILRGSVLRPADLRRP